MIRNQEGTDFTHVQGNLTLFLLQQLTHRFQCIQLTVINTQTNISKPSKAVLLLPSGQTCIQMFIDVLLSHIHATHWTLHCNTKPKHSHRSGKTFEQLFRTPKGYKTMQPRGFAAKDSGQKNAFSVKCAPELIKSITSCGFILILIRIGTLLVFFFYLLLLNANWSFYILLPVLSFVRDYFLSTTMDHCQLVIKRL